MAFIEVINELYGRLLKKLHQLMVLALSLPLNIIRWTILHPERVPKRVIQEEVMDTVLDDLNVDYILRLPMNEELLQMSADEF